MYWGTPYTEVKAGQVHRHVDFETEWQADPVTLCYSFNPLYVFGAIDHEYNIGSRGGCSGYGSDVVLVPGRVADEQVIEALSGEVDGLPRAVAHDALKDWIGCEDAPEDVDAAQRLGSEAHLSPIGASCYIADVLVKKVEVEIGERH